MAIKGTPRERLDFMRQHLQTYTKTDAEKLLNCWIKMYDRDNEQGWEFVCYEHGGTAPCKLAREVQDLLDLEARVRAVLPNLGWFERELVEHALDGVS